MEDSLALQELRQVLILQAKPGAQPINELCSVLVNFRAEINDLIAMQGGSPISEAQAEQVINVVLRLAVTVAVGLLAAAFSAMAAGTSIITALWPAAVGAIVSSLCAVFGEAVRASRHSRPLGEFLEKENTKLLVDLQKFADNARPLNHNSRSNGQDLGLARKIALSAMLTSFRAEGLALMVGWGPNHEYVQKIRQTRSILANTAKVTTGDMAALGNLVDKLNSARAGLQKCIILNHDADQPRSPASALTAMLFGQGRDLHNKPEPSTGTVEAAHLRRAIDGLSTMD